MTKVIVPINGMHCKSCELLIEENLSKISGVAKAVVDHKKGLAEINFWPGKPDHKAILKAIRSAGYEIGSGNISSKNPARPGWINRDLNDYKDLGLALLVLAGGYLALKVFGFSGMNFGSSLSNPGSYSVVFIIGLTAGFSSCMALVGGLVLGVSARYSKSHPEASAAQKFKPHLFFNLGRVLGFAALGGVLGTIGSVFRLNSFSLGFLTIAIALVMLLMGLQLTGIFPRLERVKLTLPKFIFRRLGLKTETGSYSHLKSAALGGLTFFVPCGFTQAMQLFSVATGSFVLGALVMGIFALGTAPGLLGIGGLTSVVKGAWAKRFFKLAGLAVILFAFINIANGYNLTGLDFSQPGAALNSEKVGSDPNVVMENGVQVVRMAEVSNGYKPNRFTIKKGIPVKWIIDAQAPYSCASSLVLPKYNIRKQLAAGENIIEFTPTAVGALKFSCSMGMYTGVFNVVDDLGQGAAESDLASATNNVGGSCTGSCQGSATGGCAMANGGACGCGAQ